MSKVKKIKKVDELKPAPQNAVKAKKIKSPAKDAKVAKVKKADGDAKPKKVKKDKADKPKKVKPVATEDLCKGTKLKGEPCTRKGVHDGFCYQHNPNAEKTKKVKVVKPKLNKAGNSTYKVMIGRAIFADSDRKGSSRQAVKKYMSANFNKNNNTLINES